jgi:hypothetical protein
VSESNVELLRRWFAAFNARDINRMVALSDPSVEFQSGSP